MMHILTCFVIQKNLHLFSDETSYKLHYKDVFLRMQSYMW